MKKIYGYMRVSTKEQNMDRQLKALTAAGVPQSRIYMDQISGENFKRPQYQKLLRKLDKDSVLYMFHERGIFIS